jgi:peptidoglycan lytic transglycosylase B
MWAPAIAVVLLLAAQGTAPPPAQAPAPPPAQVPTQEPALAPVPPLPLPAFDVWLAELRAEAEARGIRPDVIERALTGIEPVAQILERDRTQAEFTYSLDAYLRRRLPPRTVRTAGEMLRRHRALVERVGKAYGVDPRLLIAVWGLESEFGRFAGVRPTMPTLATLAYDPRRGAMFRNELFNALEIVDRGDIELERLKGSWAGAMGQPQFLPSSYLKFAQDFDGDGRRDIWTSLPDVLASIANYMASNGWVNGESWGRRVTLPPDFDAKLGAKAPLRTEGCRAVRQLTEPMLLNEWRAVGVKTAKGTPLPKAALAASLLRVDQETFLVYRNYETLLTYNCAHSYAVAVGLLADRLDGRLDSWPAAKKAAKPARTLKRTPARKTRPRRR